MWVCILFSLTYQILLEAISAQGPAAGPLELAHHTGLPQATTYRLLGEMQRLGLTKREGPGYRIGNRLSRLAYGGIPEARLRWALDPGLRALADGTGETSFAARLTGRSGSIPRVAASLVARDRAVSAAAGKPALSSRAASCTHAAKGTLPLSARRTALRAR